MRRWPRARPARACASRRARAPLALVIEDAHFVEETALDALEYAALAEEAAPIWICVVARPTFGRGRTDWAGRAAVRRELTLPALDPAAAAELARRLLTPAENVPASALAKLAARTEGIPLLLVELVRGLKRDGLVRRSGKGQSWTLATDELERLPDLPLVQWLASRETESLPPDLMAHARLAAVLGAEFSADEIEGVLQELERAGTAAETQLDAGIGVRRLVESGILSRHRGGRVGFRHALLRDTVYQAVPAPQREAIHRAAYEYYRRQDRLAEAARLPPMAFHAARCGLKADAGRLYMDLAARARARHAYLDAELLYKNAIENLPEDDQPRQIAAAQGRAEMRYRMGRHLDALADYAAALDRARAAGRARRAGGHPAGRGACAWTWCATGRRPSRSPRRPSALIAANPELATPVVNARLLMSRGRSLHRADKQPEALETFKKAIEVSEPLGEDAYVPYTQSLSLGGFIASMLGKFDEAEVAFERVMKVFEEHGDMWGLAAALINRATLSFLTEKIDRLLADYERDVQLCREFGMSLFEVLCTRDLGEVYLSVGKTEQAEPYIRRALQMYLQEFGELGARTVNCEVQLARCKWYAGDVPAAAELFAKVVGQAARGRGVGQHRRGADRQRQDLPGPGRHRAGDGGGRRVRRSDRAGQGAVDGAAGHRRADRVEGDVGRAVRSPRRGACKFLRTGAGHGRTVGPPGRDRIRNQIAIANAVLAPPAGSATPLRAR